jgi:thymidylate synthase (FAD)
MRMTEPEVFLVARPQIDWDEVGAYLKEVGGESWLTRLADQRLISEIEQDPADLLVEIGGRLCYRSWEPGLNANVSKVREDSGEYLDNVLKSGHGSVLEHANYSFVFHNVSRVFTHELVRHRAGMAYSQESMRFVRLTDIPFWFPEWAREDEVLMERSRILLSFMEEHQVWMADHFGLDDEGVPFAEKKAKTSFMRRFAPDGVSTGILATGNIRALRHEITMRTAEGAEEEIRLIFDRVAEIMQEEAPLLFKDYTRTTTGEWLTPYVKV